MYIDFKDYYDLYDTKVKVMGDLVEVFEYSDPIKILKDGKSEPIKKRKSYIKKEKGTGEIRADSLNRSFSRLMDLAITNHKEFKSFITLTFADNVTDLDFANYEFKKWTQRMKYKKKDFKFVAVPEFQERGAAHYHILTNVKCDSDLIPKQKKKKLYNPNTKKNIVLEYYDLPTWQLGYSSAFDLLTTDDNFSVALYISKYFWKDIDSRLFGRRKILASRNLKNPDIVKFDSKEIEKIDKYIKNKQLKKQKTVINANDYGPKKITISSYK